MERIVVNIIGGLWMEHVSSSGLVFLLVGILSSSALVASVGLPARTTMGGPVVLCSRHLGELEGQVAVETKGCFLE